MRKTNTYYSLKKSFSFAFQGIYYALKNERNLRIHFSVMLYVLYFAVRYYNFSNAEYALLLLVVGLVITCEMFNTAIEKTVDMESPVFNPLAKIAKDVAAGAVLISSITSVIVSFLLFWDIERFKIIINDILGFWFLWLPVLVLNIIFIIWPHRKSCLSHVNNKKNSARKSNFKK